MSRPSLYLVGGFLGAGKTTLLAQAAGILASANRRVGLITNDQAGDLVDTHLLRQAGFGVGEVRGGCFCCRFNDLVAVADGLLDEFQPDVLLGEPVGSCTDLSATVLQPLKHLYADRFRIGPFTVVVDPTRLRETALPAGAGLSRSVNYIYRKQIEEADVLLLNKADMEPPDEVSRLTEALRTLRPGVPVIALSALQSDGVRAWLEVVEKLDAAGQHITDVDYDTYAEGEEALGWLNAAVRLQSREPPEWTGFCRQLLDAIREAAGLRSAEIVHVKLSLTGGGGTLAGNVTGMACTPFFRGGVPAGCTQVEMLINCRVQCGPTLLRDLIEGSLSRTARSAAVEVEVLSVECFSPARPQPQHRYGEVMSNDQEGRVTEL